MPEAAHAPTPYDGADCDGPGAIGDVEAVKAKDFPTVEHFHRPPADLAIELGDDGIHLESGHGTILEMGSSMMPVAPASFSAGMSTLISALGTTVSTA